MKCILLNERSQSPKQRTVVSIIEHSGKDKNIETVKRSVVVWGWRTKEGDKLGGAQAQY
jgi:hypothetical protein